MSDKEDQKKAGKAEKNAATRFGLEDHEANQQDARVTALRSDHERRASMQPIDRRTIKSTSRIMNVNDQWSISKTEDTPSTARRNSNAATEMGLEDESATAQDPRVSTLQSAQRKQRESAHSHTMLVQKTPSVPRGMAADQAPKSKTGYDADTSEPEARTSRDPKQVSQQDSSQAPALSPAPVQGPTQATPTQGPTQGPQPAPTPTPTPAKPLDSTSESDDEMSPPEKKRPSKGATERKLSNPTTPVNTEYQGMPPKERPEDVPLPPPTMMPGSPLCSRTKRESKECPKDCALNKTGSEDDVQTSLSKLTNTDVTFNPSKKFASKGTNTSGMLYPESDEEEAEEDVLLPDQFPDSDLRNLFVLACREIRAAGGLVLQLNQKEQPAKSEESDQDNRPDSLVEDSFINAISSRFPDHKFITGERIAQSEQGMVDLTDDPTWIMQPIDGAMNYAHHFPYYCISVAYLVKKQTEFGIIYNPPMKIMYTAQRGKGAKMNGKEMQTTGQKNLSAALVLHDLASEGRQSRVSIETSQRLSKYVQAMRSIGSPVMGLAMVASGAADAYFNFGLHVWHMAAGVILVKEAGGVVIDPAGGELDIMSRRCLAASTDHLALALGSRLEQIYPSPRDDEPRPIVEVQDFTSQTDFPDTDTSESDLVAA